MNYRRIVLFGLIIAIIGIIAYLTFTFVNTYMLKKDYSDNTNNNAEVVEVDANFIIHNGYVYFVPDDVYCNMDNIDGIDTIHLNVGDGKWGAFIELVDKSKQKEGLFEDYDALEKVLADSNNYNEIKNRKLTNNNKVVSFEVSTDINNNLVAYMAAYDNYEYQILVFSGDRVTYDYDALDRVVDIISAGKKAEQ